MATMSAVQTTTISSLVAADEPSSAASAMADTHTQKGESPQLPTNGETRLFDMGVRYTAQCHSPDIPRTFVISRDKPLDIQVSDPLDTLDTPTTTPVLELVTHVFVRLKHRDSAGGSKHEAESEASKDLDAYRIDSVDKSTLVIHSAYLMKVIREVVEYYPSQNLVGETILIKEPFAILAHYADKLESKLSQKNENRVTTHNATTEEDHLRILLNFMRSNVEPKYLPARKRLEHSTKPTVTFVDAWFLLKPGLMAYADVNDTCIGCVIEEVHFEEKSISKENSDRWAVKVWFMDVVSWGVNDLCSVFTTVYINTFEGEREVTSLSVYPREYHDGSDEGQRKSHFEARGRRMQKIIWNGHQLLQHDGELASYPSSTLSAQIIVGTVTTHGIEIPDNNWTFKATRTRSEPPSVPDSKIMARVPYLLDPKKHEPEYMTQDLLFMMCPAHLAFVLSTKTWVIVNIDNTTEIKDVEKPPPPILDPSSHNIVEALADYQLKEEKPWSADFIRNKGEGIVILLHGPPGVGKTYTVESLAVRMRRPLITLSIAEIGIKESQIQAELNKWLALAEGWQAILLIDECDIFLERREASDIARNGVVAAFLRNIEYFSGLLFLTTNRVGHIDEAFMSRVHAVIHFQPLDEASRKVLWKSLLDKVHRDRPGKITIQLEAIEYLDSKEILQMDWNGREIRNAMQTAIALAEQATRKNPYYQEGLPVTVNKSHFESVLRLSKGFKDYLTSIRHEDQNRRARVYYLRNDTFTTQTEEPQQGNNATSGL